MPKTSSNQPIGIYCHVPFCASTCDFCAFYQEKPRRGDLDRYLDAMDLEFAQLPRDREVDTVFWGGGTPGLLSARDLQRLGHSLLNQLGAAPLEWTVEMAPSTVKMDKLNALRDLGVTRISMGVQSFHPELLESLGRLHNPKQIEIAWERVQSAGFAQTNLDLMFAIPGQSLEQWEADLRHAAGLSPTHLSTYCLTFEEDTALYVKLSQGKVSIDEEKELRFYERGWELLAELGYAQYEISNFSRPGAECMHNMNTWRMREWLGCGPSAASQFSGERYQRPANLGAWCAAMESGQMPKMECVVLDDTMLLIDAVIFGLRMNQGVDLCSLRRRFPGASELPQLESCLLKFEREGLLETEGSHCRLSHRGRLVCDAIGSALLQM
ncbi:MAG: radical SAM family heme chaperone HemW [Puniceicoccaceae bacterium]|nr:MAG: radical SAM family heme chaperone HemW [Puniceicoccaceae bacterium]